MSSLQLVFLHCFLKDGVPLFFPSKLHSLQKKSVWWLSSPYFIFCESSIVCMVFPCGMFQTVLETKFSCQIIRGIATAGIHCGLIEASLKAFA